MKKKIQLVDLDVKSFVVVDEQVIFGGLNRDNSADCITNPRDC